MRTTVTHTDYVLPTGSIFNNVDSDGLTVTWPVTDANGNDDFLAFNTVDPTPFYLDHPSNNLTIADTDQATGVYLSDGSCLNFQCASSVPVMAVERAFDTNDIVPTCAISQATAGGVCSIKCSRPNRRSWDPNWKDDNGIWYLADPVGMNGGLFETFMNVITPGSDISPITLAEDCRSDCSLDRVGRCVCPG